MDIVKLEKNIKKIVTNTVVPFKQLHLQKKIRDGLSDFEKSEIQGIINYHIVSCGINKELDEVAKKDIVEYLKSKCKDLSIQDIKLALENERFGEWEKTNHFQLFNIIYFADIIKKYRDWKLKKYRDLNISLTITEIKEPTAEELAKIEDEYLKVIYDEMKTNGITYKLTDDIYFKLKENGAFNISDSEKKEMYKKEKSKYLKELEYKKNHGRLMDKKNFINLIQDKKSVEKEALVRCKAILFARWCKGKLVSFDGFKLALG